MNDTGWWAEYDPDTASNFHWVPTLQVPGCLFSFEVWFATERQCLDWIRDHVIGQGFLEDVTPTSSSS